MSAHKPQRPQFIPEPGYVWCEIIGAIHTDSLDPYGVGGNSECCVEHHYPVYVQRIGDMPYRRRPR